MPVTVMLPIDSTWQSWHKCKPARFIKPLKYYEFHQNVGVLRRTVGRRPGVFLQHIFRCRAHGAVKCGARMPFCRLRACLWQQAVRDSGAL